MLPAWLVIFTSFAYLLLLFAVAHWGDRRAAQGRSVIGNAWVYALSMGVYCTAWTYFGSVGRAAAAGLWFLPIYLGPTLAMVLAVSVLRKMIRIARRHRITSIADFIASRYGKSRALASLVTLIALVGVVPYMALQLKAVAGGFALLTSSAHGAPSPPGAWWADGTLYIALVLAGFTMVFGARHLDSSERHEGLVAAIAAESVVKLLALTAIGVFVCWGLFAGPADLFARAAAVPELRSLVRLDGDGRPFAAAQWATLTVLAMLSVLFLPRQFQVMVVENVDERHVRRAAWAFPLYLLAINLFVLPIALAGLLLFGPGSGADADSFVLSLPLAAGAQGLALVAFIGGLSAATGMVIVEAIAVATMVSNDLVLPFLLRARRGAHDLTGALLATRRSVIVALLLLGFAYYRLAGEAYALVSIGLISFAAVAQFAPALIGGMYWKGGTRSGALAGLAAGFGCWIYTLLLPSFAKSGWLADSFLHDGPWGIAALRPEGLLGLGGLDNLTHSLFWSLLVNVGAYVGVSLARAPNAREAAQALLFVDALERDGSATGRTDPVFWRGRARLADLRALAERFLGAERSAALFVDTPGGDEAVADARLVQAVETELAGSIGSASARVMVASAVEEEVLELDDVMRILQETSAEAVQLRAANEQLASVDRMKDDFMSSVTHELRTPLTSIRALAELMRDAPEMSLAEREQFLGVVVAESERLTRLVNQVLDMAKIEAGQADWHTGEIDLAALLQRAVVSTQEMLRERGATIELRLPDQVPPLHADADRLLQVLLNLVSNAAKFVPAQGGRVEIRLACESEHAHIEVQDNGPGVAAAQRDLVFEKFRQGGPSANRPAGTGLGLPISRQIVEHFGGRLWLKDTAPGSGACFCVDLPWQAGEGERR